VIRGFAFVMAVGILVGTYSSIYVASPFALLWEEKIGSKSRAAARPDEAHAVRR
jgi:preprotein translocase subunit SecF